MTLTGVTTRPGQVRAVRVRAYLLGELRIAVGGRIVDTTSSRRSRNVIAYLLAHRGAPVHRDVLMDAFWPRARPEAARNSLNVALCGARRLLREASPAPIIERLLDNYRIAPAVEVWTDVDEFESACRLGRRAEHQGDTATAARHYEAAAVLFGGDLLADEPYAEWAITRRDALRALVLEAQSRLVTVYSGRGDFGAAATLARRILADDPCNEDVHRDLMRCYAGSGQRHLALLQYRRLAAALWDDLRVRPAPETTALHERLCRPEQVPRPA